MSGYNNIYGDDAFGAPRFSMPSMPKMMMPGVLSGINGMKVPAFVTDIKMTMIFLTFISIITLIFTSKAEDKLIWLDAIHTTFLVIATAYTFQMACEKKISPMIAMALLAVEFVFIIARISLIKKSEASVEDATKFKHAKGALITQTVFGILLTLGGIGLAYTNK